MKNWCIYHPKDKEVIEYLKKLNHGSNNWVCNSQGYYYINRDILNYNTHIKGPPLSYTLLTEQEFKEKVMNVKKELPQYFVIRHYPLNPLWHKYIGWLNKTYKVNYTGDSYIYYGYDGFSDLDKGTKCSNFLESFKNNPTLLTLEEWDSIVNLKEEFVLPEKWCIRPTKEQENTVFAYFKSKKSNFVCGNVSSYMWYYSPERGYHAFLNGKSTDYEGYTEITFEQFKQYILGQNMENKEEIIGYKAPYDLFGGKIKQGDLYKFKDTGYVHYLSDAYYLPKEIVETWEAVYKTKEQTYTLSNGKEVKITKDYVVCAGENVKIEKFKELAQITSKLNNTFHTWSLSLTEATFKIGCYNDVKLSDIQQIIKIHESL